MGVWSGAHTEIFAKQSASAIMLRFAAKSYVVTVMVVNAKNTIRLFFISDWVSFVPACRLKWVVGGFYLVSGTVIG